MTASMNKTFAALKLPDSTPDLLSLAEAIVIAMTDNASLPDPVPSLATVAAALADLHDAEVATQTRTYGTHATRNEKRTVLVGLLMGLKAYVQGVADGDPARAATIIESAGMSVKQRTLPQKPPFAVRPGRLSGTVTLAVRSAGDRASYHWESSTDGGVTWNRAPTTLQTTTVLAGFAPGSTPAFRYRVVTKTGPGDWSRAVTLLVP